MVLNLPIPPSLLTRFPPPSALFAEELSVDEPPDVEKKPVDRVDHEILNKRFIGGRAKKSSTKSNIFTRVARIQENNINFTIVKSSTTRGHVTWSYYV